MSWDESITRDGAGRGLEGVREPIRGRAHRRALCLLAGALAVAGFASPVLGQGMMSPEMQRKIDSQLAQIPNGEAGINEIMTGLTTRLTLTEDQQNDIRPTVEDTVANMEKSVDRFRDKQLTPMALAMQIQMAGKKAAVLIEPVLTQEQLVEYKKMQLEQRREMMKAMTTARAGGGAQP